MQQVWQLQRPMAWSGPPGKMVRRCTSSDVPSYTACTRHAVWLAANGGRVAEKSRDRVAMSRQPEVWLCWGLTVVAGCHRLEDQQRQHCSSLTGYESEQWRECLARVMAETAWWIWSVSMRSSMTTVHDWCESSSSCHRRHTHRDLWLTGPDELSHGRLVRLHWECDGDPNKLCPLCVQLQPIAGRPTRDVEDTLRHVGLEHAGIRRWGPAVNLGVICVQVLTCAKRMHVFESK